MEYDGLGDHSLMNESSYCIEENTFDRSESNTNIPETSFGKFEIGIKRDAESLLVSPVSKRPKEEHQNGPPNKVQDCLKFLAELKNSCPLKTPDLADWEAQKSIELNIHGQVFIKDELFAFL